MYPVLPLVMCSSMVWCTAGTSNLYRMSKYFSIVAVIRFFLNLCKFNIYMINKTNLPENVFAMLEME